MGDTNYDKNSPKIQISKGIQMWLERLFSRDRIANFVFKSPLSPTDLSMGKASSTLLIQCQAKALRYMSGQ